MSAQTPQRLAIQCADDGTPVGMQYSSCPDCNAQELADALVEARKEIIRLKALCEELREALRRIMEAEFGKITPAEMGRIGGGSYWTSAAAALKKAEKP